MARGICDPADKVWAVAHVLLAAALVTSRIGTMRAMLVGWSLAALLLGGCAATNTNGYREFYMPKPGVTPETIAATRAAPPTGSPRVARVGHYDESVYARQGYELIGYSSFSIGYNQSEKDAIDQAIKVGADLVVILSPEYQGVRDNKNLAVTTPTETTAHTSSTATAYGSRWPVNGLRRFDDDDLRHQNGVRANDGRPLPIQCRLLCQEALPSRSTIQDLTDSERQQMQTNRGAYVVSVVDGSPAYEIDILPGDVIVAMNGQGRERRPRP